MLPHLPLDDAQRPKSRNLKKGAAILLLLLAVIVAVVALLLPRSGVDGKDVQHHTHAQGPTYGTPNPTSR